MKQLLSIFWLVICIQLLALPAAAGKGYQSDMHGFDSLKPPYGQELTKMQYRKHFVQYAEKDGVTYYNYLGPRTPNPIYEISAPHISYGFVQGRLYCMIYQNWDVPRSKVLDQIRATYGQIPKQSYEEDGWTISTWYFKDLDVDFKIKFNHATMEMKSAFYYRPLKKMLDK